MTSYFPLPFLPRLPSNLLPHLCSTLFHTQRDPVLPNVGAAELLFLFSTLSAPPLQATPYQHQSLATLLPPSIQKVPVFLYLYHFHSILMCHVKQVFQLLCKSFLLCLQEHLISFFCSSAVIRHSSKSETSLATMLYSC